MPRTWRPALLVLLAGLGVSAFVFASGSISTGWAEVVFFGVLAFLLSPLSYPRSVSAAEAERLSNVEGRPIVYWRPGCQYCLRLRLMLVGVAGQASWVNIWTDPAGASAVRAVAEGNETVPTVVIDGDAKVNPPPRWVRARLRAGDESRPAG